MQIKKLTFVILFLFLFTLFSNLSEGIADMNSSNNIGYSLINITENPDSFHIIYVRVRNQNNQIVSYSYVERLAFESDLYLNTVYPFSDNNVSSQISETIISTESNSPIKLIDHVLWKLLLIKYTSSPSNIIVGVLPSGTLETEFGEEGSYGYSLGYVKGLNGIPAVIVENKSLDAANYKPYNTRFYMVAHEIGHVYTLCDELTGLWENQNSVLGIGSFCPNGDNSPDNEVLDTECKEFDNAWDASNTGCRAPTFRKLHPFDDAQNEFENISNQDIFRNIMGYLIPPDRRWINKDSYEVLLDKLTEPTIENGDGLLISAFVHTDGTYEVANAYRLANIPLEKENTNESYDYSIQIKTSNNLTIFEKKFQPNFIKINLGGNSSQSNTSMIMFAVPYNESLSNLQFLINDSVESQINRSPNTPSISLNSPLGGEIFNNSFNVTWSASDVDDNSLSYFVQVSDDDGATWLTIAVDLNETYLQLDNGDFSYGANYRVKVYTSDGINTNSSESTNSFTIVPPPRIIVNSIAELYSAGSMKIYEVSLLNDGGQNFSNLAWTLNKGDGGTISSTQNLNLPINEEITLLIAANYSSGGWVNVSMQAHDDVKEINGNLSGLFFVGDLRVGGSQPLYANGTYRVLEFVISNQGNETLDGISWSANISDGEDFSGNSLTLDPYKSATVIFEHAFSDSGSYSVTANVSDNFNPDGTYANLTLNDIIISGFQITQSDEFATFSFTLHNNLSKPVQVNYNLNTGNGNYSGSTTLQAVDYADFEIQHNYTASGSFTAILTGYDNYSHTTNTSLSLSINELDISMQELAGNNTEANFEIFIKNIFNKSRTFTWSFNTNNTGIIWANQAITLPVGANTTIILANNFTANGTYTIIATANTSLGNYPRQLSLII